MIPYLILTATLAGSTGWCLGHRTARIRHMPIGATAEQDTAAIEAAQAAFLAHNRRRFNDLVAGLDLPDGHDPQSTP